jgi:hypothetical protein
MHRMTAASIKRIGEIEELTKRGGWADTEALRAVKRIVSEFGTAARSSRGTCARSSAASRAGRTSCSAPGSTSG